ncbi:hypothetical protein LZ31DRAFT_470639, partial [Colletotrichum somersetense]
IQIEGPLASIGKLFPAIQCKIHLSNNTEYFQSACHELTALIYQNLYGKQSDDNTDASDDLFLQDEYLGWIKHERSYNGATFDHLVPADGLHPEVLHINIIKTKEN